MLHKITWPQFLLTIVLCLFIYYAFILLRYYSKELRALSQRSGAGNLNGNGAISTSVVLPDSGPGANPAERRPVDKGPTSSEAAKGQVTLFPESSASDSDKPELFKVMEKVIASLRTVVDDGINSGISKEELEDHIREVLANYRHLRRTPYEVAINNFIVRSCTTHFSLMLSEEDLARLW